MASFDAAVQLVLAHEGGYTPGLDGDPGGETNFGISKRSYPGLDIKSLTAADAAAIYQRDYWQPWMATANSQPFANCLLDCAVNQGLAFCQEIYNPAMSLRAFQVLRLKRYAALGKPQFDHTWFSRVLDV